MDRRVVIVEEHQMGRYASGCGVFVFMFIFIAIVIGSCNTSPKRTHRQNNYNVNITSQVTAADGLNLKAVGEFIKKVKNAEDLEKKINDATLRINNLDLDEDGKVDYIKVTEYGDKADKSFKGFSLVAILSKAKDEQEVATIEVEKSGDGANVQVTGNKQIYGSGHHYHSHYSSSNLLLWAWLWSPRPYWHSPFHYGYYPSYYRSYSVVSVNSYRSRTRGYTSGSSYKKSATSKVKSKATSPNKAKTSSKVRAPLKNPTTSQKSFQKRNPSKTTRSGGFGKSSSSRTGTSGSRSSSSYSRSVRSSSGSRSSSSFGGK